MKVLFKPSMDSSKKHRQIHPLRNQNYTQKCRVYHTNQQAKAPQKDAENENQKLLQRQPDKHDAEPTGERNHFQTRACPEEMAPEATENMRLTDCPRNLDRCSERIHAAWNEKGQQL